MIICKENAIKCRHDAFLEYPSTDQEIGKSNNLKFFATNETKWSNRIPKIVYGHISLTEENIIFINI